MPLPVERSQGSVSSLVARFQNAANRDAESTRRQSLPPVNRRTSSSGAATLPIPSKEETKPVETKESAANGVKTPTPAADPPTQPSVPTGGRAVPEEVEGVEPVEPTERTGLKAKVEKVVEGVKDLAIGGGSDAKAANEDMAHDTPEPAKAAAEISNKPSTTSSPRAVKPSGKTSPIATSSKATSKKPSPISPNAINSAKSTPRPGPRSPAVSKAATSSSTSTASPTTSTAPRSRRTSLPRSPAAATAAVPAPTKSASSTFGPAHRKEVSNTSTASATSTPSAKPGISSKPTPRSSSSASKPPASRTPRLVPSATGPVRRTPSTTPQAPDLPPLRPQLTGTPSKPTASSLAKTRTPTATPAERRQSSSLGRTTGSAARGRLSSASPSPATGTQGTPKSPPTRPITSSASRLMQGTAASRAKAAEHKSTPIQKTTPSKAKPNTAKVGPLGKKPESIEKPGRGEADEGEPSIGPPPIRLGFAAAGLGKGGKTGKEYNEERTAALRGDDNVVVAEQSEGHQGATRPTETSAETSPPSITHEANGHDHEHANGSSSRPATSNADALHTAENEIEVEVATESDHVTQHPSPAVDPSNQSQEPVNHLKTLETQANANDNGSASELGGAKGAESSDGDETRHFRDASSGSLEEIPDLA